MIRVRIHSTHSRRSFNGPEKSKRISSVTINDDAAFALVSHATQERLKYLIEQVKLIAQHRIDQTMKVEERVAVDLVVRMLAIGGF